MPVTIPDDYFRSGVWAADGPLRLKRLTCTVCGLRFTTWETFRAHRAGPECRVAATAGHILGDGPDWLRGVMPQADRDALAALAAQVPDREALEAVRALEASLPDPSPIDTVQWVEETVVERRVLD